MFVVEIVSMGKNAAKKLPLQPQGGRHSGFAPIPIATQLYILRLSSLISLLHN